MRRLLLLLFIAISMPNYSVWAQTSPFANGKWAKIAVQKEGIYKLTGTQLKSLGYSLPVSSSAWQLFNLNPSLLSEKMSPAPAFGLNENAIQVVDGGDGSFEETDYILFYSEGLVQWKYDSLSKETFFQKNTGSDSVFYYVLLGDKGKRITTSLPTIKSNTSIVDYKANYVYEIDSVNLVSSGKNWLGIPMGQGLGKVASINTNLKTEGWLPNSAIEFKTQVAATNYKDSSSFEFNWNDKVFHTNYLQSVTGLYFDEQAKFLQDRFTYNSGTTFPSSSSLKINFSCPSVNGTGWIDFIQISAKKNIGFYADSAFSFSVTEAIKPNAVASFSILNADATTLVWDVSNPEAPTQITLSSSSANTISFEQYIDRYKLFYAIKQNAFASPIVVGPVNKQDVMGSAPADYIIVTAPAFLNAANKYKNFLQSQKGFSVNVVNAFELYQEFSGGQASAIGIRNYIKTLFNKASFLNKPAPQYLLLLGMGNFDAKHLNYNKQLPVYESGGSNSYLNSYSSDDFFAVLKDNDDINVVNSISDLSIAVGRIPARETAEADTIVAKMIQYATSSTGGIWQNRLTWVADDGDYNLHLQDAEAITQNLKSKTNRWDYKKIYLDLFPASSSTSGNTFPLVNEAIKQTINEGSLLLNYTGHGNYLRLSEEAVISQEQFNSWNNKGKLPIMVTASCNFAPYDQPAFSPIAFDALLKNSNGIIALVAANRLVYAYSNREINDLFIGQLFVPDNTGQTPSIGKALQKAKMLNWQQNGDHINAYKFSLLGDPSMQLFLPKYNLVVNTLNGKNSILRDSLQGAVKYTITGKVNAANKSTLNNFNGNIVFTLLDAPKIKKTLANTASSMPVAINTQESVLFKGQSLVSSGQFSIEFILPKEVSTAAGPLKLVLSAYNDTATAMGIYDSIFVTSTNNYINTDINGPVMKAYFNNTSFVQNDWINTTPTLYIQLQDSSGIQVSGNALGQNLILQVDDQPNSIVLNDYFEADINSYQRGLVKYTLPTLSEGKHRFIVKAWDLIGNSSRDTLWAEVPSITSEKINKVSNYPNPVISKTRFSAQTNLVGKNVQCILTIMDVSGQKVYTATQNFSSADATIYMDWEGVSNFGAIVKSGQYFYTITLVEGTSIHAKAGKFIKL